MTVQVHDNGGTATGVDTSAAQTFTITTTAVTNTPPTISNITDRTILEDANTGAVAFTVGDGQTAVGQPDGEWQLVEHDAGAERATSCSVAAVPAARSR